jgi:hypothetical protein
MLEDACKRKKRHFYFGKMISIIVCIEMRELSMDFVCAIS